MTLTEYLHQTDPKRDVVVVLQKGEYRKRETIYSRTGYNYFDIPIIRERFNITQPYIRVGENPRLFASNPITGKLQESVFFLPIDDTENL